ncbi:UvrD-helicase domain-containing protein [Xenorhabdus khoisanae]|uniref:UvrD-helicase domain-containing protein n=1 Tax=Xenorhabdus khoisanae TaxID=880157 RepID=UPI002358177F|nr:UvrD-helicase domain-containing protein [Xenorhabdus khoisanae]MDC9612884.1 UvrD-helicase domain-containing protein [Xenorhabdus khoisanae]
MLIPTDEQKAVIKWNGSQLVVNAFAGTGKTSTLVNYALANPNVSMLYLAFNRAVREEAERKFPFNVECKTSHQLAWPTQGRHYRHRLVNQLRITDIARALNTRHWSFAQRVQSTLNRFLSSSDSEVKINHCPDEEIIQGVDPVRVIQGTIHVWNLMKNINNSFPITHDTYLKLYQLSRPDLSRHYQTILFDEAQDANPVTHAIVLNQKANVILVGDRHQQIYRFRGADNALDAPRLSKADRLWLTHSFRFGPRVAEIANALLALGGETRQVIGLGGDDEVLSSQELNVPHKAVLSRTVAGVIDSALSAALKEQSVYWVGGIDGYRTEELEDLYWFSVDIPQNIQQPRLLYDYKDYDEYCQIAKVTQDIEMMQSINLLERYFPFPQNLEKMRKFAVTDESKANLTVSTAHRSKGLEWLVVVLHNDFPDLFDPKLTELSRRDEINLLYVAATRARNKLIINESIECVLINQKNLKEKEKDLKEHSLEENSHEENI